MSSISTNFFLFLFHLLIVISVKASKNQSKGSCYDYAINQDTSYFPSQSASLSLGKGGPLLLQDGNLMAALSKLNRDRIPGRIVHYKGTGAFGYFELTQSLVKYTKAALLTETGKKTPILVRFSLATARADTALDLRGFAIKFYKAKGGNWDIVGNNIQGFPVRDPILFPGLARSREKNPRTNSMDMNAFWDFASLRPEGTYNTLAAFSDLGLPDGYRHMDGCTSHTFTLVNEKGETHYARFYWKTEQGLKNISIEDSFKIAGMNPDYANEDLYNAIANSNFPAWKFFVQILTPKQAEEYRWNVFDVTKLIFEEDFPLIQIGRLVLDKNPKDFNLEVERAAFDPTGYIPGLEMSRDPLLHGRAFVYRDAQNYRLGSNFEQTIKVNRPKGQNVGKEDETGPNYWPNSDQTCEPIVESSYKWSGVTGRLDTIDEDNFSQSKIYWDKLNSGEKDRLVANLAGSFHGVTDKVKMRTLNMLTSVDPALGKRVKDLIK